MFVVIGTATVDLFLRDLDDFSDLGDDGFRASNLLFTETPLSLCMGGNGGNSAYVLASLGLPTALCSAVGRDALGDMLLTWLAERDVDLSGVQRDATCATSTSTILMTGTARQIVFHHLGASRAAHLNAVTRHLLQQADVLLAASFPIMPQLRARGFAEALSLARQAGATTALDVGPAIGAPVTLDELRPLLANVDYLLGNSHEFEVITGAPDWETAAETLLAAGANQVVVKRGKDGCAVRGTNPPLDVAAFAVEAAATAGAGDAFNAGFLAGIQQGWALRDAVLYGCAVAACVVSASRGTLDAPTAAQVRAFLDERR